MTLIKAIKTMKKIGIKTLVGFAGEGRGNIDRYLQCSIDNHELALKCAPEFKIWQYSLDHENDYELVNVDGHFCIIGKYGACKMAVYGDFDTEKEMNAAVEAYLIQQQAEEIANKKVKEDPTASHKAWVAIATAMLTEAYEKTDGAFKQEFKRTIYGRTGAKQE